ncbi:hypothetical protein [Crateriforma conspicua]|uniref:PepSY domain-containing protein n=1 Tax=Crateriforma conspicua TaxID=2527996 RepID=A0A5C5YCV9_9PLAN|nr:hypothetical protein [Crateriforma conspicua]TWT72613.1 hypothetical protein Pan14r_49330 [Crateriforma conspicua]
MQNQNLHLTFAAITVLFSAIAAFAQVAGQLATGFDHSRIEETRGFMRGSGSFPSSGTNAWTSFGSQDLRETPPWLPEEDTPPLSPRDAVLVAQATAADWYSGHDDITWMLTKIALLPLESDNGKWYWQATLEVTKDGRDRDVDVVIRMDGTVLTRVNAPGKE